MKTPRKPLHHHLLDYFLPHSRNNYHPHLFSAASIAVLVFAVIVFEGAYLVQTKYVFFKTDFLASVLPGALVALTNQDRAINGLAGVIEDALLNKAAQAAAEDMAANGYFAHVSPDGKDPWYWLNQAGYTYSYAGENLAVNFTDSTDVESAWMESPTHRANIVKREYTHVGFGTANGRYEGQETTFVVEFFATPAAVSALENIAIAETPIVEATTTSTSTVQVLGSQVENADTAGAAAAAAPVPTTPSWLARLLTSPLHTLWAIFTVLFAI
ncbi:MAG: CAP domain-containing protein, partial [bacterium]|nr:CAP domain-containing protein [bacterium]